MADKTTRDSRLITLFLCGDVMTGRGIDQVLPHPSDPLIYEPYLTSAKEYVALADAVNGPIPGPVGFSYIWGDALEELERAAPDARIINLETSVTKSDDYWRGKSINYRMNPGNTPCLLAAKIDCCALANNHVLDWGYSGLEETLETLKKFNVAAAGAGRNAKEAAAPAVLNAQGQRILVFAFGSETSGIPSSWKALKNRPGVNMLPDLSDNTVEHIKKSVRAVKRRGDIVIASVHWGNNWGYEIPQEQRAFAHKLIDDAGIDVIHGHSSHHPKGVEVYKEKPIIHGCGDFLNDYEGIRGYEEYKADLVLMYFVGIERQTAKLNYMKMAAMQIKRFRVNRASREDARWLSDILSREGERLGTRLELGKDNALTLKWQA